MPHGLALNRRFHTVVRSLVLVGLLVASPGSAQQAPPAASDVPPTWWLRNARTIEPLPARLLVHVQGQYGFTRQTGNLDGTQHQGMVSLVLRKGVVTSETDAQIQKQDMEVAGGRGSIDHEALGFSQALRYDVTPWLGPQVGFLYGRDDTRFIDSRTAFYAGLSLNPITKPTLQSRLLIALGTQREVFTVSEPSHDGTHGFASTEVHWTAHPKIRLSQPGSVIWNADEADDHRWELTLSADLAVTRFFGVVLQHHVHFDNEPVPRAAEKRDARQSIMLRLSY